MARKILMISAMVLFLESLLFVIISAYKGQMVLVLIGLVIVLAMIVISSVKWSRINESGDKERALSEMQI
ncbi:MAG TPA: hypothetical protein VJI46_05675 [Candidatus Nanoarchaeia archaeon]|nr:hypothetical protein [Candidatus Nanoarchaeia archaeon]